MRRAPLLGVLTALALVLTAAPAQADQVSVSAVENITRHHASDDWCGVFAAEVLGNVNAYCFANGRTWVRVRVPGVDGDVRAVKVTRRGDCTGIDLSYRKRGDVVIVQIDERGEFDCYYKRVVVRFS